MTAVRVALTVVLAVALFAVAVQGVDAGRVERTATRLDATATEIDRAAAHLHAHEDPTASDLPGARQTVTVDLPEASWHAAPVAYVSVGGPPTGSGAESAVFYRVAERPPRRVSLGSVVRTPHGPVVFESPGRHRLALGLVRDDGGVAVSVARVEEMP